MPIKHISTSPSPGHLVQVCAGCGAEHTVSFDRGAQKAKTGPIALTVGDTLVVGVDGAPAVSVTFTVNDFSSFTEVTAAELAAKLNQALPGMVARDDAGGLLIESATLGEASRIEIVGGTAREALGFPADGQMDPCVSRPVLGISAGNNNMHDKNVIALRRCNDCGANECLVRTYDVAPTEVDGTFLKEHRRTVNALAEHCKTCGWSHPELVAHHGAERTRPRDIDDEFPQAPSVPGRRVHSGAQPTQRTAAEVHHEGR
jgi:hypothetical protein